MTARSDDCVRSIPVLPPGGLSAPFLRPAADRVVKGLVEIIAHGRTPLSGAKTSPFFFHTHLNPPLSWISLYDIAELTNDFFNAFPSGI